jgi:hypothetical protein
MAKKTQPQCPNAVLKQLRHYGLTGVRAQFHTALAQASGQSDMFYKAILPTRARA